MAGEFGEEGGLGLDGTPTGPKQKTEGTPPTGQATATIEPDEAPRQEQPKGGGNPEVDDNVEQDQARKVQQREDSENDKVVQQKQDAAKKQSDAVLSNGPATPQANPSKKGGEDDGKGAKKDENDKDRRDKVKPPAEKNNKQGQEHYQNIWDIFFQGAGDVVGKAKAKGHMRKAFTKALAEGTREDREKLSNKLNAHDEAEKKAMAKGEKQAETKAANGEEKRPLADMEKSREQKQEAYDTAKQKYDAVVKKAEALQEKYGALGVQDRRADSSAGMTVAKEMGKSVLGIGMVMSLFEDKLKDMSPKAAQDLRDELAKLNKDLEAAGQEVLKAAEELGHEDAAVKIRTAALGTGLGLSEQDLENKDLLGELDSHYLATQDQIKEVEGLKQQEQQLDSEIKELEKNTERTVEEQQQLEDKKSELEGVQSKLEVKEKALDDVNEKFMEKMANDPRFEPQMNEAKLREIESKVAPIKEAEQKLEAQQQKVQQELDGVKQDLANFDEKIENDPKLKQIQEHIEVADPEDKDDLKEELKERKEELEKERKELQDQQSKLEEQQRELAEEQQSLEAKRKPLEEKQEKLEQRQKELEAKSEPEHNDEPEPVKSTPEGHEQMESMIERSREMESEQEARREADPNLPDDFADEEWYTKDELSEIREGASSSLPTRDDPNTTPRAEAPALRGQQQGSEQEQSTKAAPTASTVVTSDPSGLTPPSTIQEQKVAPKVDEAKKAEDPSATHKVSEGTVEQLAQKKQAAAKPEKASENDHDKSASNSHNM